MAISINGTSGISGVDGSAGTPALQGTDTNTGIAFGSDVIIGSTGGTERFRCDSSGRMLVGASTSIGTSGGFAPSVQVAGNSTLAAISAGRYAANSNPPHVVLQKSRNTTIGSHTIVNSGDEVGAVSFEGSDGSAFIGAALISAFVDGTPGTNDMPGRLVFSVTADGASSPTERMRITNNGNLQAFCGAATDVFYPASAAAAGTTRWIILGHHSATGTNTGTASFGVFTNGNVVNTNNSYGTLSDIKLKENIVDANSQWDDIKALQVRNYNFKEGQTHTQIGLIAQEVELVSPGLVSEVPDRDADGNDLGTVTKLVNSSVLYMKAVKALQEAMERIESLETRLAALEVTP